MNKKSIRILSLSILFAVSEFSASAFDIKDLLNQVGQAVEDGTVTDMIEGVFSSSDLKVSDLAGEWTTTGSAVSFRSEDFLSKAGGVAAASTIESKINPYFQRFGLTNSVITIQTDGSFSMIVKNTTLKGVITKGTNNNFILSFQAFGKNNLGNVNLYVQKTSSSMDMMFDATKLKSILTSIASVSKQGLGQSLVSMLNSYEGICVGFKLNKTGIVDGETNDSSILDLFNGTNGNSDNNNSSNVNETENKSQSEDKPSIKDLFKKK